MDTWVGEQADMFFEDLYEEAVRRVEAWLDARRPFPDCFVMSDDKYEAAVDDQMRQLFEGWMKGEFDGE